MNVFNINLRPFREFLIGAMRLDGYEPFKKPPVNYEPVSEEFRLFCLRGESAGGWTTAFIREVRWIFHYSLLLSRVMKDKSVFAVFYASGKCASAKIYRDGSCLIKAGEDGDSEIPYDPPPANPYNLKMLSDTVLRREGIKSGVEEAAGKMDADDVIEADELINALSLFGACADREGCEEIWFIRRDSALYLNS
ncbi:MAG: hypothetical protein FJ088_03195 [Deltaproteobacteria bacterium]|nr:hypothetical protein [Deltaproteobacteria bacterium]